MDTFASHVKVLTGKKGQGSTYYQGNGQNAKGDGKVANTSALNLNNENGTKMNASNVNANKSNNSGFVLSGNKPNNGLTGSLNLSN